MNTLTSFISALIIVPINPEKQYRNYQSDICRPGRLCASCGTDMVEPEHILDGYPFCHSCYGEMEKCCICEAPSLMLNPHPAGLICIECINI